MTWHVLWLDLIEQTNGIFQLNIKNTAGKEATWTIDLKKAGEVVKGPKGKAGECCVWLACALTMTA